MNLTNTKIIHSPDGYVSIFLEEQFICEFDIKKGNIDEDIYKIAKHVYIDDNDNKWVL